ncbi:MAG TPA: hypothetical protein VIC28_03445 [Thermoanaerobaculia bacterium]
MSEDRILRELGHLAKEEKEAEQARLDERWDRMAAGTLTPEEDAELRALAESSPEAREAYEAFRPLGAEFQARMMNEIAGALAKDKPQPEPQPIWARLLPFRPVTFRRIGWLTAATAAAGLFLLLRLPASMPPLPAYFAEVNGGTKTFRSEEGPSAEPPVFAPGDPFQVILTPKTETLGKGLEAQCYLLRGRELRHLDVQSELDPRGAVKLTGSLGRDFQPGIWTLLAVVGRQGELPDAADLRSFVERGKIRQRDWVGVPKKVVIRPRSP